MGSLAAGDGTACPRARGVLWDAASPSLHWGWEWEVQGALWKKCCGQGQRTAQLTAAPPGRARSCQKQVQGVKGPNSGWRVPASSSSYMAPYLPWSISKVPPWAAETHRKPRSSRKLPGPVLLLLRSPGACFSPGLGLALALVMPVRFFGAESY